MINGGITTITTITGFSHIPPLRVLQVIGGVARTFVCNSGGGYHQKSGDSGDNGDVRKVAADQEIVLSDVIRRAA